MKGLIRAPVEFCYRRGDTFEKHPAVVDVICICGAKLPARMGEVTQRCTCGAVVKTFRDQTAAPLGWAEQPNQPQPLEEKFDE